MTEIRNKLKHILLKLESQIAFYPSLLALGGLILSLSAPFFEKIGTSELLCDHIDFLCVKDATTARTLLSTFIGGTISLMVFSFSLVMILLNQAANNFSPRLLPGLISNKKHQLILGLYMATLIYCIFILISIESTTESSGLPSFSVLLAIVLTLHCLVVFIYFIHSISQAIQVNNLLEGIYSKSIARLRETIEETENLNPDHAPEAGERHAYDSNTTGYYQQIMSSALLKIAEEEELYIEIIPIKGSFILNGIPLFLCDKKLKEETVTRIQDCFIYSRAELLDENYVLGFKQITEIALKAMSPGINDPGTALNAIDYLTVLFALRMQKSDLSLLSKDEKIRIKLNHVSFADLLYFVMTAFRNYCKHDVVIVQKLQLMLEYLLYQECKTDEYREAVKKEARTLVDDAAQAISNQRDLNRIEVISKRIESF